MTRSSIFAVIFSLLLMASVGIAGTNIAAGKMSKNTGDLRIQEGNLITSINNNSNTTITNSSHSAPRKKQLFEVSFDVAGDLRVGSSTVVKATIKAVEPVNNTSVHIRHQPHFNVGRERVNLGKMVAGEEKTITIPITPQINVSRDIGFGITGSHDNTQFERSFATSLDLTQKDLPSNRTPTVKTNESLQVSSTISITNNLTAPRESTDTDSTNNSSSLRSSKISSTSQSSGTAYVKGQFYYQDLVDGFYYFAPYLRVSLYDKDNGDDDYIATTTSNAQGEFSFSFDPRGYDYSTNADVYVNIYALNPAAKTTNGDKQQYSVYTDTYYDISTGETHDYGGLAPGDFNPAWVAVNAAFDEHQYIRNNGNDWTRKRIRIEWAEGTWPSHYYEFDDTGEVQKDTEHIQLPDRSSVAWNNVTVLHEYAHAAMIAMYDWDFDNIPYSGSYSCHVVYSETDAGFALIEGWAEFMQTAVTDNPEYMKDLGQDIESNHWYNVNDDGGDCPGGDQGDMDGNVVEGSDASIWFDIIDSGHASDESMDKPFNYVFQKMKNKHPQDMIDFWDYSKPGERDELRDIYYEYGIDPPTRDSDGDGIPDSDDPCPNDPNCDDDGWDDSQDPTPKDPNSDNTWREDGKNGEGKRDIDSDGTRNFNDPDNDGDSFTDGDEANQGTDPNDPNSHPSKDSDGDGIPDSDDPCPNDPNCDDDGWDDSQDPTPKDPNSDNTWREDGKNGEGKRDIDSDGTRNFNDPDNDGDGYDDGEEASAGTNPNDPDDHPNTGPTNGTIGETGSETVRQSDASQWHTVDLDNSYENPVVVMQPVSSEGPDPVHVRLRNVQSGSFEFQLEEWGYLDGPHKTETVSYTVMEAGQHTLPDGTIVEAGTVQSDEEFANVGFAQSFSTKPVVLSQSQTTNGPQPIVTRQQGISSDGFNVRVQEEEALGTHNTERVGYIAIEPGTGTNNGAGFDVGRTGDTVTDDPHTIGFSRDVGSTSVFLAGMQTFDGGDPSGLRYQNLGGTSADVFVEEEQSATDETRHVNAENAGYVAFDQTGTIVASNSAPPAEPVGETGSVTIDQSDASEWHTVTLEKSYQNPVVVMQPASADGPHPVHVRLRNVQGGSFEFQLEEWSYLDGGHTSETISYTVMEAGQHTLPDGSIVEAGTVQSDEEFANVGFAQSFSTKPVVLSQSQTTNGPQPIVTRQQGISAGGFDVRVQEEEALGTHNTERVGYIAIEPGAGTFGGIDFEAGTTGDVVTHDWQKVSFAENYGGSPALLAGMQTFDGPNAAGLRYQNLGGTSADVHVEEEQSANDETTHTNEVVGYLVITDEGLIYAK